MARKIIVQANNAQPSQIAPSAAVAEGLAHLENGGRARWTPRDYAALAREGYARNAIVYRAVRLIAESVGSLCFALYVGAADRAALWDRISKAPFLSMNEKRLASGYGPVTACSSRRYRNKYAAPVVLLMKPLVMRGGNSMEPQGWKRCKDENDKCDARYRSGGRARRRYGDGADKLAGQNNMGKPADKASQKFIKAAIEGDIAEISRQAGAGERPERSRETVRCDAGEGPRRA